MAKRKNKQKATKRKTRSSKAKKTVLCKRKRSQSKSNKAKKAIIEKSKTKKLKITKKIQKSHEVKSKKYIRSQKRSLSPNQALRNKNQKKLDLRKRRSSRRQFMVIAPNLKFQAPPNRRARFQVSKAQSKLQQHAKKIKKDGLSFFNQSTANKSQEPKIQRRCLSDHYNLQHKIKVDRDLKSEFDAAQNQKQQNQSLQVQEETESYIDKIMGSQNTEEVRKIKKRKKKLATHAEAFPLPEKYSLLTKILENVDVYLMLNRYRGKTRFLDNIIRYLEKNRVSTDISCKVNYFHFQQIIYLQPGFYKINWQMNEQTKKFTPMFDLPRKKLKKQKRNIDNNLIYRKFTLNTKLIKLVHKKHNEFLKTLPKNEQKKFKQFQKGKGWHSDFNLQGLDAIPRKSFPPKTFQQIKILKCLRFTQNF